MRFLALAAALGLSASLAAPCLAEGTVRVQQSDGTSQVYQNVNIKLVSRTLRVETADGRGALIINQASCAYQGELERCTPTRISLEQHGATKPLDLATGNIYINPTNHTVTMPLSSSQLPPRGILLNHSHADRYLHIVERADRRARTVRSLALLVALLIAAQPLGAMAAPRGGGGGARPSGGGGASRPAQAPARPSGGGGGGYNLNRDVNAGARPPQNRPSTPQNRPNTPQNRPNNGNVNNGNRNTNVNNGNRNTNINSGNRNTNVNVNRNYYNNTGYHGAVIVNPGYHGAAWGWHGGVAWYPTASYWGGGFWGAMAIGVTSAAVFGTIVANNQTYKSYQVQPSSPGAQVLNNYHLTQTQCGPPNLVVIYGPNNSVICAFPNSTVSAGNYSLDTATLSLVSP